MERIRSGVLEVHTDSGPCYLRPSLSQRIRLLWTFRNFRLLPRQVLSQRELTLVEALLERGSGADEQRLVHDRGESLLAVAQWLAETTVEGL